MATAKKGTRTTTRKMTGISIPRYKATFSDVWLSINELAKSQQKTDKQIKEMAKEVTRIDGSFGDRWGKLMEALVKGDLIKLLKEKNIDVIGVATEHKRKIDGKDYEIDLIAINGTEIVVVEVKTTLEKEEVDDFLKKLKVFKDVFKEYAKRKIYGAVAYLKENTGSVVYSEKNGLFVIRATGSSASIINKKTFKPKLFG